MYTESKSIDMCAVISDYFNEAISYTFSNFSKEELDATFNESTIHSLDKNVENLIEKMSLSLTKTATSWNVESSLLPVGIYSVSQSLNNAMK